MRHLSWARVAALLVAGAIILLAPGLAPGPARAQTNLTVEEAAYAGQVAALVHLYQAAMADLSTLSGESAARWADLSWQNDVIGEAAVFDALRQEADALAPPTRFSGSTTELQLSFAAADRAGELVRQGIEAGDLDTFARAAPELAEADDRLDDAAESGMPVPAEPIVFAKWTSCIVGPDDDVRLPKGSTKTDWEAELGIVIGKPASDVPVGNALDHVAGYCVVNDVSEREWQLERGGTWDKGKGFDTFGPIGPWMVTADEVADPQALAIWLEVDGKRYQDGTTATMVFGVAELVAYCSRLMRLLPGDIITTGTPPGVGMGQDPKVFLRGGEVMRLGIEGLGEQTQKVVAQG